MTEIYNAEKEFEILCQESRVALKKELQDNFFFFCSYFLGYRENQEFMFGRHHPVIIDTLKKVIDGEIRRLIINIPPSYTKTELAVIQFCSYCFAIEPDCRFMHISGGDTLALDNSSKIKEQIESKIYRNLWGLEFRADTKAKGLWKTNKKGQFYAISAGGQVMGFRAGRSKPGFHGAIIIDDPQKPEECLSEAQRMKFPEKYKSKIRSRVDNRNVPIIVIMQRIHEEDFCGWLLNGGSGEMWHHLSIPALII